MKANNNKEVNKTDQLRNKDKMSQEQAPRV